MSARTHLFLSWLIYYIYLSYNSNVCVAVAATAELCIVIAAKKYSTVMVLKMVSLFQSELNFKCLSTNSPLHFLPELFYLRNWLGTSSLKCRRAQKQVVIVEPCEEVAAVLWPDLISSRRRRIFQDADQTGDSGIVPSCCATWPWYTLFHDCQAVCWSICVQGFERESLLPMPMSHWTAVSMLVLC